jgi:biopolymer transport protein ExbB/TolQ
MELLTELFRHGGPVMFCIAATSLLAWTLALRAWWQSRRHLAVIELMRSDVAVDARARFAAEAEAGRLERAVWVVGALAMILPLLGLLGTVLGMLASFEVIQVHGTGQPRLLAGGIGQALLTTQAGLLTAVPVLFFHHVIRNRVRLIRHEAELLAHGGRRGA